MLNKDFWILPGIEIRGNFIKFGDSILLIFVNMEPYQFSLRCGSIWLSRVKIIYYTLFSWMYRFVGSCAHLAMVNSSWTQTHIEKLWKIPHRTKRVYPPCDTSGLQVAIFCIFIGNQVLEKKKTFGF